MFSGSSSKLPDAPFAAEASTEPVKLRRCFPDTSMSPPFPPTEPPRALMVPAKFVKPSAQTMTLPPFPFVMASADKTLCLSTTVTFAVFTPFPPWKSPPTKTSPPPASPLASIVAFLKATLSPKIFTFPPVFPAPRFDASIFPETTTFPFIDWSVTSSPRMFPLCAIASPYTSPATSFTFGADTLPELLTAARPLPKTRGFGMEGSAVPAKIFPPCSPTYTCEPAIISIAPVCDVIVPEFVTLVP